MNIKKTSQAAFNRILNGKSNPNDREGFTFTDTVTGKFGVTDSYCAVMYDSYVIVQSQDNAHHTVNVSQLFEPFNHNFHDWYSDDRMENVLVSDIIETHKKMKKDKGNDSMWYCAKQFDIRFNVQLMRDVCEALDCKKVGIYYPFNPIDVKYYKPIVIIGDKGMGLVMPMR